MRIGGASFLSGFDRLLDENGEDAAWLNRIADTFERAGGQGTLSNATLDITAAAELPNSVTALFDPHLTAAQVAALWLKSGPSDASEHELAALPLSVLRQLGNLEGVAYWARDTANRVVLDELIDQAEQRLKDLGRSTSYDPGGSTFATAFENLTALKKIRTASKDETNEGERFLISL